MHLMKKNRITIIVAIILVFAAAGLIITNSYTTLKRDVSDFSIQDTALVTKIFLADKKDRQVLLERGPNGRWTVDGKYPAHQVKIQSFLKTLKDLKVRNPVPLAARDNVITRMAAIAKKVEVYQVTPTINLFNVVKLFPREKNVRTFYVGDVTQDNQGTFMLMDGAEEPFVVHIPGFRGFVASRFSTITDEWRDYTVFSTQIGDIRSVQVEFPLETGESFRFDVDDEKNITLTDLTSMQQVTGFDTIRALNFLTAFQDIRFESLLESVVEKNYIDSVLSTAPKTIITLTDRKGQVNEVKIFHKKGFAALYQEDGAALEPFDLDRAYALVNNGEDFVLIQYYVFDRVTRKFSYFIRRGIVPGQ
jgi:hypothetical protein